MKRFKEQSLMKLSIDKWIRRLGMPLIYTDDGKLCFLIDTGASYNVLLREAYERYKSSFTKLVKDDFLLGMVGDPQKIFMVTGEISFGGVSYNGEFGVLEGTDAMNNVKILTGLQIDGAIGVEFLTKYGLVLDFARNELYDLNA